MDIVKKPSVHCEFVPTRYKSMLKSVHKNCTFWSFPTFEFFTISTELNVAEFFSALVENSEKSLVNRGNEKSG